MTTSNEFLKLFDDRYRCEQCGKSDDMTVMFTKFRVCMKCTKKNHRKATR